jgi:hypothetical protein
MYFQVKYYFTSDWVVPERQRCFGGQLGPSGPRRSPRWSTAASRPGASSRSGPAGTWRRTPRSEADRRRQRELAERFLAASWAGDVDGLIGLLAQDVVVYSDGGGKVVAARRPIFGGERVAAFLAQVAPRGWRAGYQTRFVEVNGQPGS